MKKLLVLMLVASLCALANGVIMTLEISVGGNPEPVDSEIVLVPSQCIMLDVWSSGYTPGGGDDVYWALVVLDNYEGTINSDSGRCLMPPAPDGSSLLPAGDWDEYFPGSGGVYGAIMSTSGVVAPASTYFDEIIFHCDSPHDAVVQLWSTLDFGTYLLEDQVIIHQPEPATIALLSLGGLLLRKRK